MKESEGEKRLVNHRITLINYKKELNKSQRAKFNFESQAMIERDLRRAKLTCLLIRLDNFRKSTRVGFLSTIWTVATRERLTI